MANLNHLVGLIAPLCVRFKTALTFTSSHSNTTHIEMTGGSKVIESKVTYEVPATTFVYFPKLPPELQAMIWKFVALHPRVVEIFHLETGDLSLPISARVRNSFPSMTLVPALMHTSSEARSIGQKIYEILPSSKNIVRCRDTYINWDVDTILFKNGRNFTTFCLEKAYQDNRVRHSLLEDDPSRLHPISLKCCNLAIPIGTFLRHADEIPSLFPNIEELVVVRDLFNGMPNQTTSLAPVALQGNVKLVQVKDWGKSERLNKTLGYHTKALKQTVRAKEILPSFSNTHPTQPKTSIMNAVRDERRILFRDRAFYESLAEESGFQRQLRISNSRATSTQVQSWFARMS